MLKPPASPRPTAWLRRRLLPAGRRSLRAVPVPGPFFAGPGERIAALATGGEPPGREQPALTPASGSLPSRWPWPPCHQRRQSPALLLAASLALCLPLPLRPATAAEPAGGVERAPQPADLRILMRRDSVNGQERIGVYGAKADPKVANLWSVQVWVETRDRVTIATDRIRCDPAAPLRITGSGGRVLVRQLNPGGAIHLSNRLDHLIWWAVCHPSQAGRDPAELTGEARRLGYSGQLPESQEVLSMPLPGGR